MNRAGRAGAALGLCAALAVVAGPAAAQQTHLYWGDTHLHTSASVDAYAMGDYFADPDTAYRFAKGEPVLHPRLQTRVRIDRPLDFLVVADHAERLRWQMNVRAEMPALVSAPGFAAAAALVRDEPAQTFFAADRRLDPAFFAAVESDAVRRASWAMQVDAAERHNEPGVFTTFSGWEWSSARGGNLHRVVFTPSDADVVKRFIPFANTDSDRPEDLWAWLDRTAEATGAEFIAIPHNSNLSNGLMFPETDSDGRPIDAAYARARMRWEPVMEITQVKGTSETLPAFSPNDEFADFEIYAQLLGGGTAEPHRGDYARTALLRGLNFDADLGVNPFKLGFIGSTDSHTGLTSVAEDDFLGKTVRDALPAERLAHDQSAFNAWDLSASGLAAVWATGDTRDEIAAAFRRREVYATSGPRIALRVFGGFDFRARDAMADDIAARGYARGAPMGADLTAAPRGRAPSLLFQALKDPRGANLDRVQVIKGWLDAAGEQHEQVYDAAWAGDRAPDADGRLPPVGDTVDRRTAQYANTIGAPELAGVWTDPDFDPAERAFYYVRVLEIPTPRHSAYDAVALGVDVAETATPAVIQERAWSSPIWYAPVE